MLSKRKSLKGLLNSSGIPSKLLEAKIKSFKRNSLLDLSQLSNKNVSFQRKIKRTQKILSSDSSSDSSDLSETIADYFRTTSKNIKNKTLSSDSSIASIKNEAFIENNSCMLEEICTPNSKIKLKRRRLLENASSSSAESDTNISVLNNLLKVNNVFVRKTKKSKSLRFLRDTYDSSNESQRLDVSDLLKYKLKKLRFAVCFNNAKQVRAIIAENYVKLDSDEFSNLLWQALENKNMKIMGMLIRAGVNVNVRGAGDDRDNTLLHAVVRKATTKKFEQLALLLLEYGADIEVVDVNGNTVLHCAMESGSFVIIEKLLDLGANIDAVNNLNQNVLYVAAKSPRAKKLLPHLVQYNVPDLETRNRRAMKALGYLVLIGRDLAAMKALLDLKVPINEKNDCDSTLLDYAIADQKSFEIVKLLLEHGADPNKKRSDGNFYLCLACSIKSCSTTALLIKNGAKIHVCNDDGQYPIHEACKCRSSQNIALLLFLGANVNNLDNRGCTPFSLMSTYYLHDASKIMIKHFAILTSKNIKVNKNDLLQIYTHPPMSEFYNKCLYELRNMKIMKIHNNVTAYCILTQSLLKLTRRMRSKEFDKNYYKNLINILNMFPLYSQSILKLFNVALKVRITMISLTDAIDEATSFILPKEILELVTFYTSCHRLVDFYPKYT
ncbi:ankyrin-2-like [Phymastichus coffea]|uniref:ankyrin-2-like n=1 Tax=Phymastichus coffea TaxID=108790 RepID=UPI00273AB2AA|nr:ankyrin-2-like [Phymastichus coffea]